MNSTSSVLAALVALATLSPALAGDRLGTLTVNLKVTGHEDWRNADGTDAAKVRYSQNVSFSTVVKSDGEEVDFNSRDPGYAQQQMARAAQVSLAATRAQGQKPITQAEFEARVKKEQATCGGDMQCLMNLSGRISQWTTQMMAGTSQAAPAQQGSGSYLNFYGFENCGAKIHIDLEGTTEGHYADVQGPVPFSVNFKANHEASALEREMLCVASNFVVDMPGKMFYGDGWLVQPPLGTTTRVSRGRTTTSQGQIPFREEIIAWASEQLRNAPLSGSRKATLQMLNTNGTGIPFVTTQGEGVAEVEMSWRFQ
jgi:hypothetical protein